MGWGVGGRGRGGGGGGGIGGGGEILVSSSGRDSLKKKEAPGRNACNHPRKKRVRSL